MTPTQPTPEEQVEARNIAEELGKYLASESAPVAVIQAAEHLVALLTRQSQERTGWLTEFNERGWQHRAEEAKAELDRAVEREKVWLELDESVRGAVFLYTSGVMPADRALLEIQQALANAELALAASPGKGAEGEAGLLGQSGFIPHNTAITRDPEAGPIEYEEESADG